MNQLSTEDRVRIIACLVEGNSQRATCRMTGAAKKTVARLAVELGMACEAFADRVMVDLPCSHIQCDEIWAFCGAKDAFSKKFENHRWAVALHFVHYNFCRVHQTTRITPAMAAGLSDHVWNLAELVELLDASEVVLTA